MSGPERSFRVNKVLPFLKTLRKTAIFPIQQLCIKGDPDYILCCSGVFVALELKAPGKKATPLQQAKLDDVTMKHGVALVASPDNWEHVKTVLTKIDGRKSND